MKVDLTQAQPKYGFDLDVDIALKYADGSISKATSARLPLPGSVRSPITHSVKAEKEVVDVIIDPGARLLATWKRAAALN